MSAPEVPAAPAADLAVVVVNYNAGEYVARCVTSVVEASGGLALDLLVVDNASRDGSARVAAARTPQVRLIDNPTNRGCLRRGTREPGPSTRRGSCSSTPTPRSGRAISARS